jgi:hypothetical protein
VKVKVCSIVFTGLAESLAVMVKLKLPTVVGDPEMRPVVPFSVNPAGNGADPFFVTKL